MDFQSRPVWVHINYNIYICLQALLVIESDSSSPEPRPGLAGAGEKPELKKDGEDGAVSGPENENDDDDDFWS